MKFIALFVLLITFPVRSQNYFLDHFGGTVGIVFGVGSHHNSIGLNFKGYYTDYFYQLNTNTTFYFHTKHLGGRQNFVENRTAVGLVLLAGKRQTAPDFLLDGLNHQTNYNLGVGYNYIWYNDNRGTSQASGGFGLHVREFSIYHENDVFGGKARDRFRTGHFYLSYRHNDLRYGIGVNLWTGETAGSRWEDIHMDKCPNGFRILEDLPYGKTSHGILYGSVSYRLPYGQIATIRLGLDSENIRHGFQNRLIHDELIWPFKTKRNTPHYPRLDAFGCPAFEKAAARPARLFLQWGANENWSY